MGINVKQRRNVMFHWSVHGNVGSLGFDTGSYHWYLTSVKQCLKVNIPLGILWNMWDFPWPDCCTVLQMYEKCLYYK